MSLLWTEDESMLAESAVDWARAEHPVSRFRAMRDAGQSWDPAVWEELTQLGWPAVGLEPEVGGLGLGARVAICEALGGSLVPTPLISAWLTADLDDQADAESGEVRALCWEEDGSRGRPDHLTAHVDRGRLTGHKRAVLDPGPATAWLVTARELGSIGVYRVPLDAGTVTPVGRIDHRDHAEVSFSSAPAQRIGELSDLNRALDRATVALCAELLGSTQTAFQMTLDYCRERTQFDRPIGGFQAVQHRLVDCFIEVELARSSVIAAARDPSPANVSLCKARLSESAVHVAYEAIQFHGGIGVTDEHDIGFFLKRARVAARTYGAAAYHRDRWARVHGY